VSASISVVIGGHYRQSFTAVKKKLHKCEESSGQNEFMYVQMGAVSDTEYLESAGKGALNADVSPEEEYEAWMAELREWCQPRGRKAELAAKVGCSQGLVTMWISGEREPSMRQWFKIRRLLRGRK
jgi:Helix-turn-helix